MRTLMPFKLYVLLKPILRKLYAVLYLGDKYECRICNTRLRKFILLPNGTDLLCPACGSLPRHRFLYGYLSASGDLKNNRVVLDFSPADAFRKRLKQHPGIKYYTTNYRSTTDDFGFDITDIKHGSEAFDIIICYHVLEHITDDLKAMKELYRILKPGGKILIQVPLKSGEIYEDASITSETERRKHFGQEDHVRIYSLQGLTDRLSGINFYCSLIKASEHLNEEKLTREGIKPDEYILIAQRNNN